jgi:hypothetical protein
MADTRAALDADDAAALALELRLASRASKPIRDALAVLTAALLIEAAKATATSPDGQIPPKAQAAIRTLLVAELAKLTVDAAAAVEHAATAGIRLAIRQERAVLHALDVAPPAIGAVTNKVLADPVLAAAPAAARQAFTDELHRIRAFAKAAPLRTPKQVADLAARTGGAARIVERDVRTATNRAVNTTTWKLAEAAEPSPFAPVVGEPRQPLQTRILRTPSGRTPLGPQLRVVWIAERGACLTCLALSGQVADPSSGTWFDEFATFDKQPMAVWPPDQPLTGPPRHRWCRCRLRIIAATNTMLPAALAREARRSVARGWSDHASRPGRLAAADRLLAAGARLPVTVQHRAASDVARGAFSTRHRPRVPELRADQPRTSPRGRNTP